MKKTNFELQCRIANRSLQIVGSPTPHPALAAFKGRLEITAHDFLVSHAAVRDAQSMVHKQAAEAQKALSILGRDYNAVLAAIAGNAPYEELGSPASKCDTPDDLLKNAATVEAILDQHGKEDWAINLLPAFSAVLDDATREWTESQSASLALQKLQAARRAANDEFASVIIEFRKAIKTLLGATSREYHSIKINHGSEDEQFHAPADSLAPSADLPVKPVQPQQPTPLKAANG